MKSFHNATAAAGLLRLRQQLMLAIFTVVTLVMVVLSILLISLAEKQLGQATWHHLDSSMDSLLTHLETESIISNQWLAQQERSNQALIFLSDGGKPLKFQGIWPTETSRSTLLERAQKQAYAQGLELTVRPMLPAETVRVSFPLSGDHGDRYLVQAAVLSSSSGWQTATMIKDLQQEQGQIFQMRMTCVGLLVGGIIVLLALSWWLSGRAARPISESIQRQTEFVAAASHELKSPLAVLSASASVLGMSPEQDETLRQTICRECARMGRLVSDLLVLAHSDTGTWSLESQTIDLDSILSTVAENGGFLAAKKAQQFLLDLPDSSLPSVRGDAQRLEQLLTILVDNACTYTQSGGQITLSARTSRHSIFILVKDNGPGIPRELWGRVFDRFYRADAARGGKDHSGLGLSIAQELARLHGGRLYLKEEPPYSTVFVLELPLPNKPH